MTSSNTYRILRAALQRSVFIAISMAFIVGASASFIDWRENPGGIFREGTETQWGIVMDTFLSWFMPAFWFVFILSVPILCVWSRRSHDSATRS